MNFLKKNTRIIVRSRINQKVLIRPITDYVNSKLYNNLAEYLELHKKEIKRAGFSHSLDDIINKPEIFGQFVEQLVHPEYTITFEDIYKPIWIIKTFKKETPLFLALEGSRIPNPKLKFLNQILSTYGYINKRPKYEAKSIKRNITNNE
ncbi:hypothetical protein ACIQ1D_18520 [Lysinibacillus xylanilyticus]|uniref:hypothetical protein n=1 Tax=Lysinibacillus xylanilyticus TaxID=582475 RepID=UPI0037F36E77